MIWLSDSDVLGLLDPVALIAAIESGLAGLDAGVLDEPPSVRMNGLGGGSGYLTLFPAHNPVRGLATAKVLFGDPGRARRGLPEIDAVVAVADTRTGELAALIEARQMTAMRTAAISALAIRSLMHAPDPVTVGIIGTGLQADAHARVLAAAGLSSGFIVASSQGDHARAAGLSDRLATSTGLPCTPASIDRIAAEAAIIVTVTLSDTAILRGPLRDTAILACIGPFLPHSHEIDPEIVGAAALVVSDHPVRLARQWAGHALLGKIGPDRLVALTDLAAGRCLLPSSGLRVFLSDGRGFADNIAAGLVLEAARKVGRGQLLR